MRVERRGEDSLAWLRRRHETFAAYRGFRRSGRAAHGAANAKDQPNGERNREVTGHGGKAKRAVLMASMQAEIRVAPLKISALQNHT
jgi:hypothetical protein